MGYRFFALPAHQLAEKKSAAPGADDVLIEPSLPYVHGAIERALAGAHFRDLRARDKLRELLFEDRTGPTLPGPSEKCGPAAVFAKPPGDLPALLRLADQLERLAQTETGEQAVVWKCSQCQTRYAVPVALVREVSIKCERCGTNVDLKPGMSVGEEALLDPFMGTVNTCRKQLAEFFREAMARGYPVLVCTADAP